MQNRNYALIAIGHGKLQVHSNFTALPKMLGHAVQPGPNTHIRPIPGMLSFLSHSTMTNLLCAVPEASCCNTALVWDILPTCWIWGFPKIRGTCLGVPLIRTSILGSILGYPNFGKLPFWHQTSSTAAGSKASFSRATTNMAWTCSKESRS